MLKVCVLIGLKLFVSTLLRNNKAGRVGVQLPNIFWIMSLISTHPRELTQGTYLGMLDLLILAVNS